jgi:hypothetical protein
MMRHVRQFAIAAAVGVSALAFVGCANERPMEVPANARMTTEGNGKLTLMAPEDGTVYVYDVPADRIVYSGKVEKGQTLSLDPDKDQVMLNGRVVTERVLDRGHMHRIFFQPEGTTSVERRTTVEETHVERHETR